MIIKISFSFVVALTFATQSFAKFEDRCSTLSCVHSSATIIKNLNPEINPCEDFYTYACGTFLEEQHTPDEKSTVNTLNQMNDKLTEYLLTLLLKPSLDNEPKLHKLAKSFFNTCQDTEKINDRGKEPLLNMIKASGHWPILEGKNWNESLFDWKNTILNFRKYTNKKDDDIFAGLKELTNEIDIGNKKLVDDDDSAKIEKSLKTLIFSIAASLNAEDTPELMKDIDEMIDFEKKLEENQKKFKMFKKIYDLNIKNKSGGFKKSPKLQKYYKYALYLNLLAPFPLVDTINVKGDIPITFNIEYEKFIDNTPKRTIANYVIWRMVSASLHFVDRDLRNFLLTYEKEAFGKEDVEQRWVSCALLASHFIPVAIGSLYISQYFTEDDKKNAEQLVEFILQEYQDTISRATWMDESTKKRALLTASKMSKYIGYHSKLRSSEAETYYDELAGFSKDNFLEMGLAIQILATDREFRRLHAKKKPGEAQEDWTKYSKPATINAFYNSIDNSIRFPAAILQSPNFDKDRPPYMNFGAIGSIIGHEITHSFDDQSTKVEEWSTESRQAYQERVQCIINQYSSYRVADVEEYFADEGIGEFHLNGNFTQKEDIADCGGIKLALNAYKAFEAKYPEAKITPIGLQEFDKDKLFWLSFAQTFCSVERPAKMKNRVEADNHSLEKFRVIGAISNMKEFAAAWNCPEGSKMNPKTKCAVW